MHISMRYPALILLIAITACSPRAVSIEEGDEVFVPSQRNPTEVLEQIQGQQPPLHTLGGRGRVQLSSPGNTDRSAVLFISDRERTLLTFRNSLGIEAGKLLVEPDSVTLYNRIDQYARRVSTSDQDALLESGFYAVNMLSVLSPDMEERSPRSLHESAESWRFTFDDHTRMFFSRDTGELTRMEFRVMSPVAFSTYLFANRMDEQHYYLPRNIQILSNDRRSNIFITIQSYDINPSNPQFDLNIPSSITIFR
ncbi:MAG: DUF4292 domain-containing protein [Bacteroidetes bacterium]|nr:DUF4292 domain-containing protein [Bacteroidota bacterium]MCH8523581.1 DUF4292 domain-containing protein [Balneolales bacterium]